MASDDPLDNPDLPARTRAEILEGRRMLRVNHARENVEATTKKLEQRFGLSIAAAVLWVSKEGEGEVNAVVTVDPKLKKAFTEKLSEYPSDEVIAFLMLAGIKP